MNLIKNNSIKKIIMCTFVQVKLHKSFLIVPTTTFHQQLDFLKLSLNTKKLFFIFETMNIQIGSQSLI